MYKKILLSSAIAVAMGTAGVAQAAVDLDDANSGPIAFAQEADIGTGVILDVSTAGGGAAVTGEFGFTIAQGTSKYARIGFDEPLAGDLLITDFTATLAGAGSADFSISQGGTEGDTYVIVEIAAVGDDILQDDSINFAPNYTNATTGSIGATSQTTRSIAYDLYETAVDAVNETNVLVSKSKDWITWEVGYAVECGAPSSAVKRIDVVDPRQFLDVTFVSPVAGVDISAETGVFNLAGIQVDIVADYFAEGSEIVIAGSTEGFEVADGFNIGGVVPSDVVGGSDPLDGSATFVTDDGTNGIQLPLSADFSVDADETNEMVPSTYSLSITNGGTTSFDVGTVTVDCGSLQYSGSTDRLDFALTPNGAFQQFARITNPSQTAGDVTVTVYNDEGTSVTFPLGDVAGVETSIESRGSTKLININDIYAAAQAADATFALAATGPDSRNKLRVEVRGEFGDDAVDGNSDTTVERLNDGIYIQGLTVSRDNNAFFQTK